MQNAGDLDERIAILRRPARARMTGGVPRATDFEPLLERWAKVMRRTGASQIEAGVPHDTRPAEVLVRADPETRRIHAGDRCVLQRELSVYDITACVQDARNFEMMRLTLSAAPISTQP